MSSFSVSGVTYKRINNSTMSQIVSDAGTLNLAETASRKFQLAQSLSRNPSKILTNQPTVSNVTSTTPSFSIY